MIPVFIIGISPRSGTNYLFNLLALHPDCAKTRHYGEDFIMRHSHKYLDYVQSVTKSWISEWENNPDDFYASMQSGILKYLTPQDTTAHYFVTKTPHPENADLFLKMFDHGYMILITRKGQDLAESFFRSFKGRFDDALRGYRFGAKEVLKVLQDQEMMSSGRVICIKYEDLYQHNELTMKKLFDFLGLDPSTFDFKRSAEFDIIGSSSIRDENKKLTWDPVKKDSSFDPLNRSSHWTRWQHYRFNWIAGKYAVALGYDLSYSSGGIIYYTYNMFRMMTDFTLRVFRRIYLTVIGN